MQSETQKQTKTDRETGKHTLRQIMLGERERKTQTDTKSQTRKQKKIDTETGKHIVRHQR